MRTIFFLVLVGIGAAVGYSDPGDDFRFAVLGDRQGGAVPGVYEQVLREIEADHPDFTISVGDTIDGGDDLAIDAQWTEAMNILRPFSRHPIFLVPGNHDVWSIASAMAFEKYSKHPLHYSFDFKQAHFTVLDNSRSDSLSNDEIAYLSKDLELHEKQPLKFIFSHRPSWILQMFMRNPNFPLAQLAKKYGVRYIIAGHVHEMMHFKLDDIDYISIASSGGHLRDTKEYQKGWFFGHVLVNVKENLAAFQIKEAKPPAGEGRITSLGDWTGPSLTPSASQ